MVSTESAVDIGIQLMIMEAFDEEKACEHYRHDDPLQSHAHAGNAEWYLHIKCPRCDYSNGLTAVCDKYMKAVDHSPFVRCRGCSAVCEMTILVKERIKG